MAQYYFYVASLPMLAFGTDRYPAYERFMQGCEENLGEEDLAIVAAATLEPSGAIAAGPAALSRWQRFEIGLRNELARQRGGELGWQSELRTDEQGEDQTQQIGLSELVREARGQASPLAADELLDRARWELLEELEVGHFFDVERLVVYALKVQMLERRAGLEKQAGSERFAEISELIVNAYYQEQSRV